MTYLRTIEFERKSQMGKWKEIEREQQTQSLLFLLFLLLLLQFQCPSANYVKKQRRVRKVRKQRSVGKSPTLIMYANKVEEN